MNTDLKNQFTSMPNTQSKATKSQHNGNGTKRKASDGAPFIEPPPKHRRSKKEVTSTVTPSPKAKGTNNTNREVQLSSPWLVHDKLLKGATANDKITFESNFDKSWINVVMNNWESGFGAAMEELLDDPMFDHAHLVESSAVEKRKWRQYAFNLAKFPTDVVKLVLDEYRKDMTMHDQLLKGLRKEINERRFGGKRFYLRALNCIFYDSFTRCHVPLPPLPMWKIEIEEGIIRNELYKKQLSAWHSYKTRVFELLGVVIANPTETEGDVKVPSVLPLQHRGEMVQMNENCKNEEKCIPFKKIVKEKALKVADDEGVKDLTDRPACKCRICKKEFKQLLRVIRERELMSA
jgi:hypothetical protein